MSSHTQRTPDDSFFTVHTVKVNPVHMYPMYTMHKCITLYSHDYVSTYLLNNFNSCVSSVTPLVAQQEETIFYVTIFYDLKSPRQ